LPAEHEATLIDRRDRFRRKQCRSSIGIAAVEREAEASEDVADLLLSLQGFQPVRKRLQPRITFCHQRGHH
jgi:hypothetical protein